MTKAVRNLSAFNCAVLFASISRDTSSNLRAISRALGGDRWIAIVRAIAVNEVVTFASTTIRSRILLREELAAERDLLVINSRRLARVEFILIQNSRFGEAVYARPNGHAPMTKARGEDRAMRANSPDRIAWISR